MRELGALGLVLVLVAGCGSESPADDGGAGVDGGPGSDAGGADAGAREDGGGADSGIDACVPVVAAAVPASIDLYVMLDRSGSMDDAIAAGGTKWSAVVSALDTYVTSADLGATRIGLQYFGLPAAACPVSCSSDADCGACGPCLGGSCVGAGASDSCDPADYATPDVEVGVVASVASAITSSLAAHAPGTGAPTSAALEGALQHGAELAAASPTPHVVAVLITDGDPSACDTSIDALDAIAASALSATPPVRTAVISLGLVGFAHGVAAAGGTGMALEIDLTGGVSGAVLDAMRRVPEVAGVACTYTIPEGADPSTLEVQRTPGIGSASIVPRVASEAACSPSAPGWHVDDETTPREIVLCPGTCAMHLADPASTIETLTGC